uniref:(northern house mosquito) hypothetical protein n=1 Tax=Culex pipiens TaxID=7175 RepID=A0A8D8L8M5_CULPI
MIDAVPAVVKVPTSVERRLLGVTGQVVVAPGAGASVHPRGRVVHRPVIVTADATPETPWVPQAVALFEGVLELAPKFAVLPAAASSELNAFGVLFALAGHRSVLDCAAGSPVGGGGASSLQPNNG